MPVSDDNESGEVSTKKMPKACAHCGGIVDEDGFAREMADEAVASGEEPEAHEADGTVNLGPNGFAEAIRRRGAR